MAQDWIYVENNTMKLYTLLSFLTLSLLASSLWAQTGGENTYEFLRITPHARAAALGGYVIAVMDEDVNLAIQNPAALNPLMDEQISFNHGFYPGGIHHNFLAYSKSFDTNKAKRKKWYPEAWNTFAALQYVNYGEMNVTNELNEIEGTFKPIDYALHLGAAINYDDKMQIGLTTKWIGSQLESYKSFGLALDLGVMYVDTAKSISYSFVLKNMGTQLKAYTKGNTERLPFEAQIGITKRLEHLPFRFGIIYRYLEQYDIYYDDPNAESTTLFIGDGVSEDPKIKAIADNFFRHFVFNGEFLLGKSDNFRIRFGYNHLLKKEMALTSLRSMAGFSAGFGFKVKRFRIDYGRTGFHLGAGLNQFTFSTNFNEFKK